MAGKRKDSKKATKSTPAAEQLSHSNPAAAIDSGNGAVATSLEERVTNADLLALIVTRPGICGGDPTIMGTRMTVWGLTRARQIGYTDADLLEMYPFLGQRHLDAAWEYARLHPTEIGKQIKDNEV